MSVDGESIDIPRHGNAGVAFLGVEFGDAIILLASVFIAIPVGAQVGTLAFLGIPAAGFFLNRLYIDWRANSLPGQSARFFYGLGILGYSKGLSSRSVVYVGDGRVINPGNNQRIESACRGE